jgi:hypothetical protein
MRSLNTLSLIGASLLYVTRGHMTQEIPSATVPTLINIKISRKLDLLLFICTKDFKEFRVFR